MKISKNRLLVLLSIAAAIVVTGVLVRSGRPSPTSFLKIATATPGGTYDVIGTELARILDRLLRERFDSVRAIPTAGSVDNIGRLATGEVQLALVTRSALLAAQDSILEEIRLLADLYPDVVQVVVRRDPVVDGLQDLTDMRVYLGRDGSGTETIAREILSAVGISSTDQDAMRSGTENDGYAGASSKLVSDSLDAAFFVGGMPVAAVVSVMATGRFKILDLSSDIGALQDSIPRFSAKYDALTVLAQTYRNQPDSAKTIATIAQLVARENLDDDVVVSTLGALYTDLDLLEHARAEDIRSERPDTTSTLRLHDGVEQFWKEREEKLLILTGSLTGAYYDTGVRIREFLEGDGIEAWVAHTDGSLENLHRLADDWDGGVIALVQYDVVRAALHGPESIYGIPSDELPGFPTFALRPAQDLRLIANLGPEWAHVVIRRDALGDQEATVLALKGLRVSLGPERSGTRLIAEYIVREHAVEVLDRPMPVETMVAQLEAGQLDAGFFIGAAPSSALKGLVANPAFTILSVDPLSMPTQRPAFEIASLPAGFYGSQVAGEEVVTISTTAVVVAFEDLRDAYQITRAITLARGLPESSAGPDPFGQFYPLELHDEAEEYYQFREFLPAPPPKLFGFFEVERVLDPLTAIAQVLLILAILLGAYRGGLKMKRDITTREVGKRVFAISVEATEVASVRKLLEIRREIRDRAKRRRWQAGEINTDRWRVLEDLVNDGIQNAKQHLERALITEIRKPPPQVQDDHEAGRDYYATVRERIWRHLENGELDAAQHGRLLEVLSGSLAEA